MLGKIEEMRLISECVILDNRNAFARLVEEYSDGLRRFLLNLTLGDVMLSEDLAQETFIKAYINLRNFKGISRFKTWLYRIAVNQYYSHLAQLKTTTGIDSAASLPSLDSPYTADAKIDVAKCMASLSDIERTIVTLFYLNDMPIKELCKITSLNENTVKSHLFRAKNKMKILLANELI